MSIVFSDIVPHEMIKVLVNSDDIEEDFYAKVISNEGDKLFVSYISPSSKIYKGACIYSFDSKVEIAKKTEWYSSFHITCYCEEPAIFMNPDVWPEGAYLRWWKKASIKSTNTEISMSQTQLNLQ